MLKTITAAVMVFICGTICAQNNVGINVANPTENLSVAKGVIIDNDNENTGADLTNGLKFGKAALSTQLAGISSTRITGSELYSLNFYTGGLKRMVILQNGLVGINMVPTSYFLEVGGTIRGNTLRSVGSIYAEGGSVNASSSVNASTSISAVTNITTSTGDIIATTGELSAGGRGVIMNNGAGRLKYASYTAGLTVSNLAPGSSVVGHITYSSSTFSALPVAYVGNVVNATGDYYKVMLVLENVTDTGLDVRVVNVSTTSANFSGATWKVIAIGAF